MAMAWYMKGGMSREFEDRGKEGYMLPKEFWNLFHGPQGFLVEDNIIRFCCHKGISKLLF